MSKAIALLALGLAAGTARADVDRYRLIYQGFEVNGTYYADRTFDVSFGADDLNHDGTYTLDELVTFSGNGFVYPGYCGESQPLRSCVTAFSFTQGGPVAFSARSAYSDGQNVIGRDVVAGDHYYWHWFGPGAAIMETWRWTPQTTLTITGIQALPVPEPATYGMLGAGLALLGVARRRMPR